MSTEAIAADELKLFEMPAQAELPLPGDLQDLADSLHDAGHVELGILIVSYYQRFNRLLKMGEFLLETDA
jgi:hypothetical protein